MHSAKANNPQKIHQKPTLMPESQVEEVNRHKANLPLPEDPPVPSDWQSADARTVNVGSGRVPTGGMDTASVGLREPATKGSDTEEMSRLGREAKDNLPGPPKDASY